jgi:hypothetical protein
MYIGNCVEAVVRPLARVNCRYKEIRICPGGTDNNIQQVRIPRTTQQLARPSQVRMPTRSQP